MTALRLTLACGRYDRTQPLIDGRVKPEGVDLNYISLDPEELFWRMSMYQEFDASEFSLGAYCILLGRKDYRFVGIPIFPSRFFRHSSIFINAKSGITRPQDLKGKRMGVPDYTMTANVWIRGLFEHEYDVKPKEMIWYTGGLNEPGRKQRIATKPIEGLRIYHSETETLSDMLKENKIDALIGAREPKCFREGLPQIQRLWPNYKEMEQEYFRRTKIFPIMHLIVLRREIYEKNRWLAQSLCKAFMESKNMCFREISVHSALRYMLPWGINEFESTVELMGEDFWPYGIEANRDTLKTFIEYSGEQGQAESPVDVDELFAPETRVTARI